MSSLNQRIKEIEENASNLLSGKLSKGEQIPEHFFSKAVLRATECVVDPDFNPDILISDIPQEEIVRKLQEKFSISMDLGTMVVDAERYRPWIKEASADMDWYYWGRYVKELKSNGFPPDVINKLSQITETILDHAENPKKEGGWDRRGMVVGYVQSGKTANYTGVISRAADAGYKVIIVLAGTLNALRNQTQERIDQGFLGYCTKLRKYIGAGINDRSRKPAHFTTSISDFKKSVATQLGVGIGDLKEPAVFVIKKNTSTLKNIISWLKDNNQHNLSQYPMMLIDDEADNASVNTNNPDKDASAINSRIRELISLFNQSTYIGYTATPFANIFIDPDTEDDVIKDDLFPRDFILSLDPPSNYQGPHIIFKQGGETIVRNVTDYEYAFPLKHKKDHIPSVIPESLKEAINSFIITKAIRVLRDQVDAHHSMMINVSRFTDVQTNIKSILYDCLNNEIVPAVRNYSELPFEEALESKVIKSLFETWEKEFKSCYGNWSEIQKLLIKSATIIDIIEVNSSKSAEPLNYNRDDYPNGRTLIAVGGLSLSRGLTLEGLCVTYFLRNSRMYDTLLQMGRWFGYRDGYSDICRLYMTSEAHGWYIHISGVIEELRGDLKRMKQLNMTPNDFGLAVRSHPESLIVTARNKMRSGVKVVRQINLEGRLVETRALSSIPKIIKNNRQGLEALVGKLQANYSNHQYNGKSHYYWKEVDRDLVKTFIESVQNHPESNLTEPDPLLAYIEWLNRNGYDSWDVILYSPNDNEKSTLKFDEIAGLRVNYQYRTVNEHGSYVAFPRRRIASLSSEKVGLSDEQVRLAEEGEISDKNYRLQRNKPLLMLHFLDCSLDKSTRVPLFDKGIVGWGLSFPGESGRGRPKKLVEYDVNVRYYQQNHKFDFDEEEDYE